jgi:hypothetical protein
MSRYALMAAVLVGACANVDLDARLKPMVGASEPALLAAMAPGVKVLQWHWQRSYAIPDRLLAYSYAGGTIRPIAHTPTGIVRDECVAEWTVEQGVATRYSWIGNDCAVAATGLAER